MWWWWRRECRVVNLYKWATFYLFLGLHSALEKLTGVGSVPFAKSLSRKGSMQRHVMAKQRKTCLTPFQTVAMPSKKCQRFRFEHPFTCTVTGVTRSKKKSMGSIFITASFRGNFPSPGEVSLVLFTMATCVYKNASGHAMHWICERNSYGFGVGVLLWCEQKEFDHVWWSDDLRQQRQANCEHLYSWFPSSQSKRDLYRAESISSRERKPQHLKKRSLLGAIQEPSRQMYPGQTHFFLNQYKDPLDTY